MSVEKKIRDEIQEHKESINREEKTLKLWTKDINRWSENLLSGNEKNRQSCIEIMADQASGMVNLIRSINILEELIKLKTETLENYKK